MPRAPNRNKRKGAEVELLFLYEAWKRNLIVSHPYGDVASYDFITEYRARCQRVQVKLLTNPKYGGTVPCAGGYRHHKPYTKRDIDVLAIYAPQSSVWYLIPVEAFSPVTRLRVAPHNPNARGQFECWRDAWYVLTDGPGPIPRRHRVKWHRRRKRRRN